VEVRCSCLERQEEEEEEEEEGDDDDDDDDCKSYVKVNTSVKNEQYTRYKVSVWIHSDRRSTKAITETPIRTMTEQV
jgi:hypothetical protein